MQRTIRPRSFPLSFFRYFTRQITRENKIEGKEEGTPTAKSWLFAYRSAGQLRQRSKNPYVDCCALSISLSYLYSDAPGLVPNQQKKKKKKNKKQEREKKKLPGQREDIKLVHSSSTARLISHLTNFSFVFADSNREDSPKINVTIQIILWLPPEKKNTRLPTPLHTRVTPLHYYNYCTTWWISTKQMKKMKGMERRSAQTKPLPNFSSSRVVCWIIIKPTSSELREISIHLSRTIYIYWARNTCTAESKKTKRKKTKTKEQPEKGKAKVCCSARVDLKSSKIRRKKGQCSGHYTMGTLIVSRII